MTLQPDPDPQDRTLVEPEGVNAGSDRSTVEGDREPAPPPVAGDGDDIAARAAADRPSGDRARAALAPGTDAVESGQDDGGMS